MHGQGKLTKEMENKKNIQQHVADKVKLVTKLASLFVVCFCSLFLLLAVLEYAQSTKAIEMQMNN